MKHGPLYLTNYQAAIRTQTASFSATASLLPPASIRLRRRYRQWADLAIVEAAPNGADPELGVLEAAAGGGVAGTVVAGELVHDRLRT